jgi:hypothetical protein
MEEFTARLPEEARPLQKPQNLSALVRSACWRDLAAGNPNEVHFVMARLGLPLYLTTNPDSLLFEALLACGRRPLREQCRWHDGLEDLPTQLGEQAGLGSPATQNDTDKGSNEEYQFSEDSPVVYHLFGTDEVPESLVLSEDQYFRYLYNIAAVYDRIQPSIRARMASSSLMFIGFSLYDWEFRVIMHGLVKNLQNRFKIRHVAVQLEEEDAAGSDLQEVQAFLEQYFSEADINVYWGSTAQFVAELREEWEGTLA